MRQMRIVGSAGRQRAFSFALLALMAGGLTACGGEQVSAPATVLPASTVRVQETAASSPAAGSPAAAEATPASGSPMAGATPVGDVDPERLAADCAAYQAWLSDPEVKAALDKAALWPDVIAQGEKAAAGEPVDTAVAKQASDQLMGLGKQLRNSDAGDGDHTPLELVGRAMGLTFRLASNLGEGNLDAQGAAAAVTEVKAAIAAYQQDAAARQASCG